MTTPDPALMALAESSPDPNCPICSKSSFGIPGCLVLDVMQVEAARQRWQWAELGPGANDCPCIQLPEGRN